MNLAWLQEFAYPISAALFAASAYISIRYYYRYRRESMALWVAAIFAVEAGAILVRSLAVGQYIVTDTAVLALLAISFIIDVLLIFYYRRVISLLNSIVRKR